MKKIVDDERLIYKVCCLYYQDNMNQKEIGDYLGVSRSSVLRMLQKGKELGIVKIKLNNPSTFDYGEMEKKLENMYGLKDVLIVEQYVSGREFSCGIVDGEAYPVIEIAPLHGFYDYTNKYKAGSTVETCPADISKELSNRIQKASLAAYRALHLNSYGRIDVMMDENENVYCLEANTLPGMTPTSLLPQEAAAIGMDFPALCEKLIEVSLKRGN